MHSDLNSMIAASGRKLATLSWAYLLHAMSLNLNSELDLKDN